MRLAPLALALALAGCAAPPAGPAPGSYVDHEGWSEYAPAWTSGPANATFDGKAIRIAPNETYATDGSTFFYATRGDAHDASAAAACRAGHRQASGIWVLLVAQGCAWSQFPGVACDGTAACDDALRS